MATQTPAQLAQFIDGPALAGIFMNVMLYGVMVTQTFFYYTTYQSDPKWMKYYVGLLFTADTLNSVFNMWWIYNVLVNNFGNVDAVLRANWLFETEEALGGIIGFQVQTFYAWRLWKLTQNKWLVGTICCLSFIQCLAAIGTSINIALEPIFTNFEHYKEAVLTWLAATALTDIIIAASLIWILRTKRTGHSRTETVISRIIQITMSNGLLTAGFALTDIIAFVATNGGLHLAFNYTLCKLYGNSVMSSLNSRAILTTSQGNHATFQGESSAARHGDFNDYVSSNAIKVPRTAHVVVNVERHEMVDVPTSERNSDFGDTKADVVV